jgi:hypothetical protein
MRARDLHSECLLLRVSGFAPINSCREFRCLGALESDAVLVVLFDAEAHASANRHVNDRGRMDFDVQATESSGLQCDR